MQIRILESLSQISARQWNALVRANYPFLRYEFLRALEQHDCLGERTGWFPHHLICSDETGRMLGALPLYLKDNSYGEFVFDWGWADAYQRHGLAYYPKLVCAIPFTPATGPRVLVSSDTEVNPQAVSKALITAALNEAERLDCSSLHCLFAEQDDLKHFDKQGFMSRVGCHFHWHNAGYGDFADFLGALSAKKRKNIKRERRLVGDAGLTLQTLSGAQASESQWHNFYQFYQNTFHERGRYPPLTKAFFLGLAETMGEQIVLALARNGNEDVAGAISYRSDEALFGRHWGCRADYDSLHFECCYYQGINYCIEHGLKRFEPGVQGEHKIWRGFLPTITRSAHWLAHPAFSEAIADFLRRETPAVHAYARELSEHSPYKQASS